MPRFLYLFAVIILISSAAAAQKRIYTTYRISGESPKIDGIFDDKAWDQTTWTGEFTQHEPYTGQPASQNTEFSVIYDDNFIYFAVKCYDTAIDSITRRMTRRDTEEGDWVRIIIDSYHDLRTAFSFGVNASGSKMDEAVTEDYNWDSSWDPIWEVKTSQDSAGWNIEAAIPFSQLRFGKELEFIWGFEVGRYLHRKGELSLWQFISPTAAGFVNRMGELHGIENIKPSKQKDFTPYLAFGRENFKPEKDNPFSTGKNYIKNAGIDGKIGITNDLTLDFTINPDFGQVESDPSEVNLTTYETKFSEKRPFFIEGKNILSFGLLNGGGPLAGDNLFYSRRIGRRPSYSPDLPDDQFINTPKNTTITGAVKLTGKTRDGWSVGILDGVTQKERAEIAASGELSKITVEPLTNYFISRVRKDMNNTNTTIGGMFTATNRKITETYIEDNMRGQAYTAGIDLFHQWKDKTYYIIFNSVFSRMIGSTTAIYNTQTSAPHFFQRPDAKHLKVDSTLTKLDGMGGTLQAGKAGNGKWMYTAWITWRSPGLNLNEAGYMNRNDEIQQIAWLGFRQREPFSIFRNFNMDFNQWSGASFGPEMRYFGGNINSQCLFKNYWNLGFGIDRDQKSISTETLRGGPALMYDGSFSFYPWISTDDRKKVQMGFSPMFYWRDLKSAQQQSYSFSFRFQVTNGFNVSLNPGFSKRYDDIEYVASLDEPEQPRYIRGKIQQTTAWTTLRMNYTVTPDFTIQFYGMPFISAGSFSEFKYINKPDARQFNDRFILFTDDQISYNESEEEFHIDENTDGLIDYSFGKPDFNIFDFNSNLVIRWEYKPGSVLYLVWSQNRNEYISGGKFSFSDDVNTLFKDTYPRDVFLIKLSYRFGL